MILEVLTGTNFEGKSVLKYTKPKERITIRHVQLFSEFWNSEIKSIPEPSGHGFTLIFP